MSITLVNRNLGFLASWARRVQELEDAAWALLNAITAQNWTGDLLDKIGSRVGEPRNNRGDVEYLAAVRIRIRVNRSFGRAEDVIDVARLASINSTPTYDEYYPGMFEVGCVNLPGGATVARLLRSTRSVGTYGTLNFTPDTSTPLTLDDAVTTLAGAGLLNDSVLSLGGAGALSCALAC